MTAFLSLLFLFPFLLFFYFFFFSFFFVKIPFFLFISFFSSFFPFVFHHGEKRKGNEMGLKESHRIRDSNYINFMWWTVEKNSRDRLDFHKCNWGLILLLYNVVAIRLPCLYPESVIFSKLRWKREHIVIYLKKWTQSEYLVAEVIFHAYFCD